MLSSCSRGCGCVMRACHIVYGYFPFDPRVRREVETLRGHGHEVDVIALQEPGDAREESILGFHVYRVPLPIVRGGFARYAYPYLTFLLVQPPRGLRPPGRSPSPPGPPPLSSRSHSLPARFSGILRGSTSSPGGSSNSRSSRGDARDSCCAFQPESL